MKKVKNLLSIVLALALLTACGSNTSNTGKDSVSSGDSAGGNTSQTPVQSSEADSYPKEPVRIIVPFAPGGGGDTMIRTIEPFWKDTLGANFSIENMGGSGTQIGMTEIFNAGSDPYVIGVISQPHTSLTIDVQDAPYTLDDFCCINLHNYDPQSVFVMEDFASKNNINDFKDLVAYMEENPGVSFGISSMTGGHLWTAYMLQEFGLDAVMVPYGGGSEARTALAGGIVDVMVMNEAASLGQEGVKCLGVNWTESTLWEGVPTISELYPDSDVAKVGIAAANLKFVGCNAKLKQEHPEIFDKIVETYEKAYLNEEHLKICEGQGLRDYMKWYGPEESQNLWYSIQEISSEYAYLFK